MQKCVAILGALLLIASVSFAQATQPSADHKIRSVPAKVALEQPVPELKGAGVTLAQAFDFLRDISGLNIDVNWHALENAKVTQDTPVSLRLHDVPLRRALQALLDDSGASEPLTFYVQDGIIEVTTQEWADKDMVTRVYPVADLVSPLTDFHAPQINLANQNTQVSGQGGGGAGSAGTGLFSGTSNAQQNTPVSRQQLADELVQKIRESIRPDVWKENGGPATIQYLNGNLIVTAPRSVQQQISR